MQEHSKTFQYTVNSHAPTEFPHNDTVQYMLNSHIVPAEWPHMYSDAVHCTLSIHAVATEQSHSHTVPYTLRIHAVPTEQSHCDTMQFTPFLRLHAVPTERPHSDTVQPTEWPHSDTVQHSVVTALIDQSHLLTPAGPGLSGKHCSQSLRQPHSRESRQKIGLLRARFINKYYSTDPLNTGVYSGSSGYCQPAVTM